MDVNDLFELAISRAVKQHLEQSQVTEPQRLFTLEDGARYLGCTVSHVKNLIAAGVLPVFRWPWPDERKREKPYLDKRDLDRIIDEGKERLLVRSA